MPSIATLYKIAAALGVSPRDFLPGRGRLAGQRHAGRATGSVAPVGDEDGSALSRVVAGGPGRMIEAHTYDVAAGRRARRLVRARRRGPARRRSTGAVLVELGDGQHLELATGDVLWHVSTRRPTAGRRTAAGPPAARQRPPGRRPSRPHGGCRSRGISRRAVHMRDTKRKRTPSYGSAPMLISTTNHHRGARVLRRDRGRCRRARARSPPRAVATTTMTRAAPRPRTRRPPRPPPPRATTPDTDGRPAARRPPRRGDAPEARRRLQRRLAGRIVGRVRLRRRQRAARRRASSARSPCRTTCSPVPTPRTRCGRSPTTGSTRSSPTRSTTATTSRPSPPTTRTRCSSTPAGSVTSPATSATTRSRSTSRRTSRASSPPARSRATSPGPVASTSPSAGR